MSNVISKHIAIAASKEKVFNFITNPHKIPLVMPSVIRNEDIPDLPMKVGDKFTYVFQMFGINLTGNWHVTRIDPNDVYEARTDGGAESQWKYTLHEENGVTELYLDISYETPHNVLETIKATVIENINTRETETFLENLKVTIENR